jgi:hypothetical protein
MLDAGGGGGYGGTNWSTMSVIDMWLAISNQETTPHWQLLTGWRKSYELTLQHMSQVRNYRENLAAAWPPEKSPAAAAYLARLDELIAHLQGTYDAAVANYTAFSNATLALSSARTELDKVVNEYLANEGKLATFEREQAERPKGGLQRGPAPKPPVADGRQAELEAKARSIMYGLSTEISQARAQVTQPIRYSPDLVRGDEERNGSSPAFTAPVVPPVVPFDPAHVVGGSALSSGVSTPSPSAGSFPGTTPPRTPGLILGGVETPLPAPSPPASNPPPLVGGPSPTTITPSPGLPPSANPANPIQAPSNGRAITGTGPARPSLGAPPSNGARTMPPGGVIGGMPGAGVAQPAAPARPTPQVNPVGGIINPNGSPPMKDSTPGRTPTSAQTMPQILGRSNASAETANEQPRWDPDNPWVTAQGVSPVVYPVAEVPVDPGPAIGLR